MINEHNFINILIISMDDHYTKRVAAKFSETLDMFFADCHDLVVYDLGNPKEVALKCGYEYMKKRECGVIKNCSSYENTTISIDFSLFKEYYEKFSKSFQIYLCLEEKKIRKVPYKTSFIAHDDFLRKTCDMVIPLEQKSVKEAIKKIATKMEEML